MADYTFLPKELSAQTTLTDLQKRILLGLGIFLGSLFVWHWAVALRGVVGILMAFYLADVLHQFFVAFRSLIRQPEITIHSDVLSSLRQGELPVYSILCPLYKETEVVGQFLGAIDKLDWPKDKLDVQILLEEDDRETQAALRRMNVPAYITVRVVPSGYPQTKPRACNFGLLYARGEFIVIYDAEDIPEPAQLKKVYASFLQADEKVACMQAKLAFYNETQNVLTRLFAAEYLLWFGMVLPGLQSFNAVIPLGGTSNHFRTSVLKSLKGWDSYNVTEDCDLGIRLYRFGFRTAIIDSTTYEEANSAAGNWLRQRSRWIKGYMQSYLVAMRAPRELSRQGLWRYISFHLTVGGKALSLFINPLFWFLTAGYVLARGIFGPVIDVMYNAPLLYLGSISLVAGNFLYFYAHMMAVAKHRRWGLMKYVFFVPVYWLMMSVAGWLAFWQLLRNPHYWEKTAHGLHLETARTGLEA